MSSSSLILLMSTTSFFLRTIGCERNMTGLPVRLTTGSCERLIERWMRSSCRRCASACLYSRARWRRSFSFYRSAASTSSRGIASMMERSSSSFACAAAAYEQL